MSFRSYKEKPPTQTISELDLSDRLQRIKNSAARVGFDYEFSEHMERRELVTIQYKRKFPDDVTMNIGWIKRLLLPRPNMFELDRETGELDKDHRVKQALVYHVNEYVDNPSIEEGPISYHCTMGWYPSPVTRHKFDKMGNIVYPPKLVDHKNIFYTEFTPKAVDEVLSKMDNQPNSMVVGIARQQGDLNDKSFAIPNMDEFKNVENIEQLIEANEKGYLRRDFGGFNEYLDAKEEAKKSARTVKSRVNNPRATVE